MQSKRTPVMGALHRVRTVTWLEHAVVIAACAVIAVLLADLLTFGYGRDQGIYAVVAREMLRGAVPYRDVWDFKPPGIFFVFAASRAVLGGAPWAIRLLEAGAWASLVVAFALLSQRHVGSWRTGVVAGATAVAVHVQLGFWHTAQPESFGAVAISWALVCAGARRRSALAQRLAWCGAGALFSVAGLMKPPLAGGALVSALLLARRERSTGSSRPWAPLFWVAVGGLVPLAATVVWFALRGGLREMVQTLFVFAPQYTALGFSLRRMPLLLHQALADWLVRFSPWEVPGLAFLAALAPCGRREREGVAHVLGAVMPQVAGIALQAKFFPYHYAAVLPFAALLGTWGYAKLWWAVRHRPRAAVSTALGLCLLSGFVVWRFPPQRVLWEECLLRFEAVLDPARRRTVLDRLHTVADADAAENRRVAAWLRRHTGRHDTVFIWGFEPVVYDMAGRRPASRYIYNVPQRAAWEAGRARQKLLDDLRLHRPAAIVVESGDAMPWVTGTRMDSRQALAQFAGLRHLLERQYRPAARIGDFLVYVRKEGAGSGGPAGRGGHASNRANSPASR